MIFSAHTPIVLVVDDEPVNVEILATLLSQDYHVKVANNGQTALTIASQQPQPDLILLDVMMPEMDGFDVCRALKANPATRDISVIFITAAANELSESQGLQLGAVDYITKPINRIITRLRVKNHLDFLQSKRDLIEYGNFLHTLVENAPHGAWVVTRDDRWLLVNRTALAWLECEDLQQVRGTLPFSFVDAAYRQVFIAQHQLALSGETAYAQVQMTGTQGAHRWLEVTLSPLVDAAGQIFASLALASDITQRRKVEASLRLSAKVFECAQEGIVITNLQGRIEDVNPAFTRITGYAREDVLGRNPNMLKSGVQTDEFYRELWQALQDDGHWQGEIWNRNKKGEIYPEWLSISRIYDEQGQVEQYLGVFTDISSLKQHEKQLEKIAHYDALTGISNRILLGDRMKQAIAQSRREHTLLAVCYLDLDGFKPVNDELGHEAGDLVLIECARRLESVIREMDTVARLGGDEFVILLQGLDNARECSLTLDRLLKAIAQPIHVEGRLCEISASVGVTLFPMDDGESDILLRHADQAMYTAKQSGKNRYHFFDTEQDDRLRQFNAGLKRTAQALEKQEFVLFYQPKVDLLTNRCVGAEALIRWRHPERGLLSPMEFLPSIHGTDLEIRIDDWVVGTAMQQLRQWHQQGVVLALSINLTASYLQTDDFIVRLTDKLATCPELIENCLQFEILETAALADFDRMRLIISAAQQLGIGFALDDFGTGYSSLTFLRNLPANTLKIDQSFVRDMLEDQADYAIIQGIIALAQTFHREIVAEGVETMQHCRALAAMGCHIAQGYGIARPMSAEDFVSWYYKNSSNLQPPE